MAEKLERKVMEIYGENAATRDIIAYGSDIAGNIVETKDPDVIQTEAYKTGVRSAVVGNNSTTLQNRQALDFLFSRQLKYLYQHGIAEWGADETYFVNSLAVGSNGNLYVSLTDNNKGNDPVTDTTNWQAFPTPAQLAQKVAKAGDTMSGQLVMENGSNGIRFNGPTSDNFYYVNCFKSEEGDNIGRFLSNSEKGLLLINGFPYYFDGTNGYRLLTINDLNNTIRRLNWDAMISWNAGSVAPAQGMAVFGGWGSDQQVYLRFQPAGSSQVYEINCGYNNDAGLSGTFLLNPGDRAYTSNGCAGYFVPFA